jgi:regulator of sirC expression with transglutaminase-like and TPR domain
LVKFSHGEGEVVLDPFFKGVSLSEKALEGRIRHLLGGDVPARDFLPHLLTGATKKETLVRMLRNLKAIYLKHDDQLKALSCTDRILAVVPNNAQELRDRGDLYERLECPRAAVADFVRYLELTPEAEDAEDVRRRLVELQASALRLN